jgi:hypothetical protein
LSLDFLLDDGQVHCTLTRKVGGGTIMSEDDQMTVSPEVIHMRIRPYRAAMIALMWAALAVVALPSPVIAHCDSMDGPVVKDAQRAIADKNVTPVLKWVRAGDEDEIRRAFQMVLAVRGESDAARTIADRYFFETLIRVHRASEGEGFTGLKPAGSVDPAIAAADKALADGSVDELANGLVTAMRDAVKARFALAHTRRQTADQSVDQGREYVDAYVEFTHFVESAHHLIAAGASHKHAENRGGH